MSGGGKPTRSSVLDELLGEGVETVECRPSLDFVNELLPEELPLIEKAVEKRKAEFAAARVMARQAMLHLGVAAVPLLRYDSRAPRWPDGIIGTITHTRDYCAVALTNAAELRSIGIDAEVNEPLKPELVERVCTEAERHWLQSRAKEERGCLAKLIFSAKEAFYKCQHPITQTYLGFQDVTLEFDVDTFEFHVATVHKLEGEAASVGAAKGTYKISDELIVTAMRLPSGDS